MTINGISVKRTYKPARIISDVISLGITGVIVYMTATFGARYKETVNSLPNVWELLEKYRYSLATRYRTAWIFPALCAVIFAAYLILTMRSRTFKRVKITKGNAQSVCESYAFTVSLCKIPLLMIVFDYMYIVQQRLMFNRASLLSVSAVIYALMLAIIIRAGAHKLKAFTDKDKQDSSTGGGVRAKLADDNEDKE